MPAQFNPIKSESLDDFSGEEYWYKIWGMLEKLAWEWKKLLASSSFCMMVWSVRGGAKHRWKTDETDENPSIDKNFLVDWQIEDSAEYV